jgi:hypothetical protein
LDVNKDAAQRRADQIAAFRAELDQLAREGGPAIDPAALTAVHAHQDALLAQLAREFDVDRTLAARRMSLGMRIASFLGAAALVAAIVSFFYRIWDSFGTPAQVVFLVVAPMVALAAMIAAGRIEKTRYVASICALVACGAFVLETVALSRLFNLRESPHFLGFWTVFALSVALPWRFRIPYALGAVALAVYLGALVFEIVGVPWTHVIERPEPLIAAAALLLVAAHRAVPEMAPVARAVLLVVMLLPLLLLSSVSGLSLLPIDIDSARVIYQVVAFGAACIVIAAALRYGQLETLAIGSTFAGLFIVTRFVDWWWDWMPKYLFFLIMAAVAIGWLWTLRVARRRLEAP